MVRAVNGLYTTYFIGSDPYDGWAKIGRTTGLVSTRLGGLQTGSPRRLRVYAEWDSEDHEALLHDYYAPLRGLGEWFELPRGLLDEAATLRDVARPGIRLIMAWDLARVAQAAAESRRNVGREHLGACANRKPVRDTPQSHPTPLSDS